MRKNDLIAKLQQIKGNPEVMLWNGFVSDFVPFGTISEQDLVKITWEHYLDMCRIEDCLKRKDFDFKHSEEDIVRLKQSYKQHCNWEYNEFIYKDDIEQKRYKSKRIVSIEVKVTGKQAFNRLGTICY